MAQLKSGKLADFADSMAEAMEKAMEQEWQAFKGQPLPDAGKDERRILFTSVSMGVLNYLKQHQNEILNTITLEGTGLSHVTALDVNVPE